MATGLILELFLSRADGAKSQRLTLNFIRRPFQY